MMSMLKAFGKYTIEKELGKGGMGAVYLAVDPILNRKVAIKIITSADAEALARFQLEAQAVAKLKHDNIVQVYEAGLADGQHYLAMEYVDGTSLDKLIASAHKPSFEGIANITLHVARALDYAHQQKIIHRDIKPANVLIDKQGKVYLADFGLAKQLSGLNKSLTISGTTLGTPDYMPPEQAMGKTAEIDQRSDIFSLGATLYYCLAGRSPFQGKELYETLSNVINNDPPLPSTLVPVRGGSPPIILLQTKSKMDRAVIPKDLETICLKCLEKDKAKRYQTAQELVQDIRRYLAGNAITTRRTAYLSKIWYKAKKNPLASAGIASALAISLVTVGIWFWSAMQTSGRVALYRQEAHSYYETGELEQALAACDKILDIGFDSEIDELRDKCDAAINKKSNQHKSLVEKNQLRAKAKEILDRANAPNVPAEQRIKIAREALNVDPNFGEAYQMLGSAYKENDIKTAYEYFSKAIEVSPTLAYAYYERSLIAPYIYNKKQDATEDLKKVIELDPDSPIGHYAKGEFEFGRQRFDEALSSFSKAIELYPNYAEAYHRRGLVRKEMEDTVLAIADFTMAIQLNQKDANLYNDRGAAYAAIGRLEQAVADFAEAIRLEPGSYSYLFNRGRILLQLGKIDQVLADCTEVIRLQPQYGEAYYQRALAQAEKKAFKEAVADAETALKLITDTDGRRAILNNVVYWSRQQDDESVFQSANEAISRNPSDPAGYYSRGTFYFNRGEYDLAIVDFSEVIRLDSTHLKAYNDRAGAYQVKAEREGNLAECRELLDRAIADYTAAIKFGGSDAETSHIYNNRGLACVNKAEHEFHQGGINSDMCRELIARAIADYSQALKGSTSNDAAILGSRGEAYFKIGDYDRAIADYTAAITLRPRNNVNYYRRARAYHHKGNLDQAIADYSQAIKFNPDNYQAYGNRGLIYLNRDDLGRALSDLNKAISLNPNDATFQNNRAMVYYKKGDFARALVDYSVSICLDPTDAQVYHNRGLAYEKIGDEEQADADYKEAFRLDPKTAQRYINKVSQKIAAQTEIIRKNPRDANAYIQRGLAYTDKNEIDNALADFTTAINLNPNDDKAYYYRGSLFSYNKDPARAIADYTAGIKLDRSEVSLPASPQAVPLIGAQGYAEVLYYNRGLLYLGRGELDSAIDDFTNVIRRSPGHYSAYLNRAKAYNQKGETDKAMVDLAEVLKIKPDSADAYSLLGDIYFNRGDFDMAITKYTDALKINPSFGRVYMNRGQAYGMKQEFDLAIADFNEALKFQPDNALNYFTRGLVYDKQGQFSKAFGDYNAAIRLDPKCYDAYLRRAIRYAQLLDYKAAIADGEVFIRNTTDPRQKVGVELRLKEWRKQIGE